MTQLSLSSVGVEFGATEVFDDMSFAVGKGDRWGIIGRNGTGKTTLFKLITGDLQPTRGAMTRAPGLRVALLEQYRDFGSASTVWEAAAGQFAELLALEQSLADQATRLGELGERATPQMLGRYDRDLDRFEREGGYTFAPRVDAVLHGLGFDPTEARTRPLERLSGGERGRLGLARQLVAPADMLLLDEPTNHLDLDTTRWLEQYIRDSDETVLLISHDRAFLESVVDHVLHFEAGTAKPYVGTYSDFVIQREERRLTQHRVFSQQRREVLKEEDYIRRNIAGQNSKQAKGRRKRLERLPRLSPPPSAEDSMSLRLESGERGGEQVLVADDVHLGVPQSQPQGPRSNSGEFDGQADPISGGTQPSEMRALLEHFSVRVVRGDVVGLIGPNGAGKSTLLRSIIGEHSVARGELRIGSSVTPAYYRQDLTQVPTERSLYDVINDLRPSWTRGQVLGHLARFGFTGDSVQRTTATLSGGERARVALAMIMLARANLLLLDEPTNHLDVESIEALEDAVEGFGGTVLLVSHDRALLRALATRVWVLHERQITDFDGSFAEWEAASAERERAAAVAAEEEEELRRVHERQRVRRSGHGQKREELARKASRRAMEDAEAEVERLEARVAGLTKSLEDPALYTTPDGTRQAATLGADLERAKRDLDMALARWAEVAEG